MPKKQFKRILRAKPVTLPPTPPTPKPAGSSVFEREYRARLTEEAPQYKPYLTVTPDPSCDRFTVVDLRPGEGGPEEKTYSLAELAEKYPLPAVPASVVTQVVESLESLRDRLAAIEVRKAAAKRDEAEVIPRQYQALIAPWATWEADLAESTERLGDAVELATAWRGKLREEGNLTWLGLHALLQKCEERLEATRQIIETLGRARQIAEGKRSAPKPFDSDEKNTPPFFRAVLRPWHGVSPPTTCPATTETEALLAKLSACLTEIADRQEVPGSEAVSSTAKVIPPDRTMPRDIPEMPTTNVHDFVPQGFRHE